MSDFVIETQIDKLIDLLSKRRKIALSEAARILNVKESILDTWISTLEDRGVVELKYPVLGEPEIVLKGILPENLKIIPEAKKPEEKIEVKVQKPEISEAERKLEPSYTEALESEEKEIKGLEEKITNLEERILEVSEEMDITKLKEELFEVLIIISSLDDTEKITSYLSFIERIIMALKAKKAWDKVDKDLMVSTLKNISGNWKESGKEDISKIFEEMAKRIETI
jgi:hypothetical protein